MAIADLLKLDGRTLWWGLEISTDDFATVSYRWATAAGVVGGNFYQDKLLKVGNIQRGLGVDHLPVASTVELEIKNTDFAADFLVARATVESTVFKCRFKLHMGLADDTANTYQATILTQQVGVFVCLDFPSRNDKTIKLSLADDSMGKLADLLVAPTMADWREDAGNTADNALFSNVAWGNELEALIDFNVPLPLQFGRSPYVGMPTWINNNTPTPANFDTGTWGTGRRKYLSCIVVCATRDSAVVTADDVGQLRGTFLIEGSKENPTSNNNYASGPEQSGFGASTITIPQTFTNKVTPALSRIWKSYKTQTITKNGYDWKILWIAFDAQAYTDWFTVAHLNPAIARGIAAQIPVRYADFNVDIWGNYVAAFDSFQIAGIPGSGITGITPSTVGNPAHIMRDLVKYYSSAGTAGTDTSRFIRAANATALKAKGIVSAGDGAYAAISAQQLNSDISAYGIGRLRSAIADLARSSDMDVFCTSEGKIAVAVMAADFDSQTTTYPTLSEARIGNVIDKTPSFGERWSPYNRVFLKCPDGTARGPFDDVAAIAAWGRILSKSLECKWWNDDIVRGYVGDRVVAKDAPQVRFLRFIESKVRPVISFTTDLSILALELADYFILSWTRGGQNSAYASTLWRLESVSIDGSNGQVDVTAVWMDDIQTDDPFLLDNESLVIRVTPVAGRNLTVTDASNVVTASSGDFVADGVLPEDQLLIRDSTEAATGFTRNRLVRIASVFSATILEIDGSDLDFGTAGAHVIDDLDWSIVKSYRTYPTAVSDAVNYPSGSAFYGKVGDVSGLFSDATAANKLLDG